jgi:primary-amine oxidase
MAVDLTSHVTKIAAPHPLEPLSPEEIASAVAIVRACGKLGPKARFVTVVLHEPSKQAVVAYREGDSIEREAFVIILDNADGATYEAVVSITMARSSWTHIPCQLHHVDEFFECENTWCDPGFQAALRAGLHRLQPTDGRPMVSGLLWRSGRTHAPGASLNMVRADSNDNGYARPVEGLLVRDPNAMKPSRSRITVAVRLRSPATILPTMSAPRQDLRPRHHPTRGPSFTVKGHEVRCRNGASASDLPGVACPVYDMLRRSGPYAR